MTPGCRIEMSIIQEVDMFNRDSVKRLDDKSPMHAIQVELQQGVR